MKDARSVVMDAAYVAVGFGVLAAQKAAVGVQEARRRLPPEAVEAVDAPAVRGRETVNRLVEAAANVRAR
jgi:site-specific recombinase